MQYAVTLLADIPNFIVNHSALTKLLCYLLAFTYL